MFPTKYSVEEEMKCKECSAYVKLYEQESVKMHALWYISLLIPVTHITQEFSQT